MDTNKQKLTDTQLRVVQIVLGIVAAVALFLSIILPTKLVSDEKSLLHYAFVVVFLVITMARRTVENKYRLRLNLFNLALMDGVLAAVIVFATFGFYPENANPKDVLANLDNTIKILIIAGLCLLLLVLGILIPAMRYFKRKANGTLPPIRIPEKPQPEETEQEPDEDRPMTIEEKIAAMSRELDENNTADDTNSIQNAEEETEDKPKE
jgi:Na+-transporting methylmalonyl-CoA/oxaloacetate decarboxylase gamma subunit